VAKIESPIGFEGGKAKAGGLSDPRLGTMDRGTRCTTDGNNVQVRAASLRSIDPDDQWQWCTGTLIFGGSPGIGFRRINIKWSGNPHRDFND
jgi:hypothetical protein